MADTTLTILYTIQALCVVAAVGCVFALVRNQWVYRARTRMIDTDWAAYQRLPDYGTMMRRFWVWRVRDFLKNA